MKRTTVSRARDKHIFNKTASRTKAINVNPLNMRGGIRI